MKANFAARVCEQNTSLLIYLPISACKLTGILEGDYVAVQMEKHVPQQPVKEEVKEG